VKKKRLQQHRQLLISSTFVLVLQAVIRTTHVALLSHPTDNLQCYALLLLYFGQKNRVSTFTDKNSRTYPGLWEHFARTFLQPANV